MELAETLFRADAGPAGADPALMDRLRSHFADGALVELTWAIAQYIGLGKMIVFLGLESGAERQSANVAEPQFK